MTCALPGAKHVVLLTMGWEDLPKAWSERGVTDCDPAATVANIRRLKELSIREGLMLVPGHDPVVWPALTEELCQSKGVWQGAEM